MIKSFRHKGLKAFYSTGSKAGIQAKHADRLRLILARLDAAYEAEDMDLPGLRLHKLTGDLKGYWAVDVSGNWRIIFKFEGHDAHVVDYLDPLKGDKIMMHNPPHPGEAIKKLCIEPLGLSITETAKALGVSRKTLSELVNGRAGISPEMAVRLSIAFNTTPESWLNQQMQYDLWELRKKKIKVKQLKAA